MVILQIGDLVLLDLNFLHIHRGESFHDPSH